jgi:hypothetical protein
MTIKNYNWTSANIATWNKVTFPDNNRIKQLTKLESEISEWKQAIARQHKLEELADIFIAAAGFSRFSSVGSFICYLLQILDANDAVINPSKHLSLKDAIDCKMIINRQRKFDEQMHHIEGL